MPDSNPAQARSIALVVSVCVNVILVCIIAIGAGRAGGGFIAQPGGQLSPGVIARGLSPDAQGKIRGIVAEHRGAMREARQGARRARLKAFRDFAAPDYTPDAFAKSLEQVRAADSTMEEEAILMLRDIINSLTPQERNTVVTRVRSGANRPWWRRLFQTPPAPTG